MDYCVENRTHATHVVNPAATRCNIFICIYLFISHLQGKDKFPAYWLGPFFHPRSLLSLLRQDMIRVHGQNITQVEPMTFQTEITARDKDHVSTHR